MAEIFRLSNGKVKALQNEVKDLKEALYGYVLDTAPVEVTDTIPSTVTVDSTTYNLADNVRGLVNEVKGNTVKSDNLLNIADKVSTTVNGVTYSINDGVITLNGTCSEESWFNLLTLIDLPIGSYYITDFNFSNNCYFYLTYTGNYFRNESFTLNEERSLYSYIYVKNGATLNNVKLKPMLVKGTQAPSEFMPYFEDLKSVNFRGLKINGSNLLNIADKASTTTNGITYSISNGVITLNGTYNDYFIVNLLNMYLEKGTYYIEEFSPYADTQFFLNDTNLSFPHNRSFTITQSCEYLFSMQIGNHTYSNHTLKPMLVKGTVAPSEFKPYKEPITILPFNTTLRGVGTPKDKIVITKNANDDYYTATKVSNAGEVNLGSLEISRLSNDETYNGYFLAIVPNIKVSTNNVISTIYSGGYSDYSYSNLPNMCIRVENGNNQITIKNTSYTDAAAFKTAMAGVMLCYELATPTTTVLSATLTEADVMPLLELGGTVEIVNINSDYVTGSTVIEMVYKLINGAAAVSTQAATYSDDTTSDDTPTENEEAANNE